MEKYPKDQTYLFFDRIFCFHRIMQLQTIREPKTEDHHYGRGTIKVKGKT